MSNKPTHAPLTQFPLVDDQLVIAGKTIKQILEQGIHTPFYVYDEPAIRQRVGRLSVLLPKELHLHYAIKANPFQPLVNLLAKLVNGLDIASDGELKLALESGMSPANISFAGPGKTDAELTAAIEAHITLNVESANELQRISALGNVTGIRPRVALRVNPDFELKSSGMRMGGGARPFGIDSEQMPAVLQLVKTLDLTFLGLHIFSGSQNLRTERIIEAQNATFELAYRLVEPSGIDLHSLNIGGGLGIPYFPGEQPLDVIPIADNLHQQIADYHQKLGPIQVIMELGRYLVGEAGVYICKVIDKKHSRGKTYLIVNGGLHHHLAASGNFGQVIRKNYPVLNPERVTDGPRETVTVVGPLCTPLDVLADNMEMGMAEVGDHIAVLQSGAYGYSASPLGFLSHPAPVQCLL